MSWFSFGRKAVAPDRSDVTPAFSLERNGAGPGRPLESGVREAMGAHFGADFSGVRIHDDPASGRLATAFGAAAFSIGSRIGFAPGAYAPETRAGRRLLGHELAHTLQQTEAGEESPLVSPPGEPAEREAEAAGRAVAEGRAARVAMRTGLRVAAQPAGPPTWRQKLDEILPVHGGLVFRIGRVQTLLDVFGEPGLEWLVNAIHADPAARQVVTDSGVSGMLALGDTVAGGKLDVAAATKELAADKKLTADKRRYKQPSPKGLKISIGPAPQPPAPSVWFGEGGTAAPGGGPTTARSGIFVEPTSGFSHIPAIPASRGVPGTSAVSVRFAYPQSEIGPTGTSKKVTDAKAAILRAIGQLLADLTSFPGGTAAQVRGQQETRARLKEALRGFDDAHPLNVFIATLESPAELGALHPPPTTDRIFVDAADVGDEAKLQAAIRMPIRHVLGGVAATGGTTQAATPAELERTVLHESLHALLIRRKADGETVWNTEKAALTITGPESVKRLCESVLHGYLVAQEELFAYDQVATLLPPVDPARDLVYAPIVKSIEKFLRDHGTSDVRRFSLKVDEKVGGKAVSWEIAYRVPRTAAVTNQNRDLLEFLRGLWPSEVVNRP
jgi:hypothetical protein